MFQLRALYSLKCFLGKILRQKKNFSKRVLEKKKFEERERGREVGKEEEKVEDGGGGGKKEEELLRKFGQKG